MTAPPPPLGSGIVFDQILVGGAASLLNLIIHAVLLAIVVWTVRNLQTRDTFVPAFLQYTVMISRPERCWWRDICLRSCSGPSPMTWWERRHPTPICSISPSETIRRSVMATSRRWMAGGCSGR